MVVLTSCVGAGFPTFRVTHKASAKVALDVFVCFFSLRVVSVELCIQLLLSQSCVLWRYHCFFLFMWRHMISCFVFFPIWILSILAIILLGSWSVYLVNCWQIARLVRFQKQQVYVPVLWFLFLLHRLLTLLSNFYGLRDVTVVYTVHFLKSIFWHLNRNIF